MKLICCRCCQPAHLFSAVCANLLTCCCCLCQCAHLLLPCVPMSSSVAAVCADVLTCCLCMAGRGPAAVSLSAEQHWPTCRYAVTRQLFTNEARLHVKQAPQACTQVSVQLTVSSSCVTLISLVSCTRRWKVGHSADPAGKTPLLCPHARLDDDPFVSSCLTWNERNCEHVPCTLERVGAAHQLVLHWRKHATSPAQCKCWCLSQSCSLSAQARPRY